MRAYQLSQGTLLPVLAQHSDGSFDAGGFLPACLQDTCEPFMRMKFHPEEKVSGSEWLQGIKHPFSAKPEAFVGFQNTAIYPPVSYIPQILGIWLTRLLRASPLVMMYVGRVFNLIFWVAMVFLAVRLMPCQKWVPVLVGLMPMSIFLAASLSADPLINGMSMMFVALLARALLGETDQLAPVEKVGIGLLSIGIGLAKIVYSPLVAMILLIPARKLGGAKRKVFFCITVIVCAAVVAVGWAYLIKGFIVTREWTNPPAQLSFVEHNPIAYLRILLRTMSPFWFSYNSTQLVGVLGWLDTLLPDWIHWSYLAVTVLAAVVSDSEGRTLRASERVIILILSLLCVVLVTTAEFVIWTPPGNPVVAGVQGRYFIPLLVPLLLVLTNRRFVVTNRWYARVACSYCVIVLLSTCYAVVERYYQ